MAQHLQAYFKSENDAEAAHARLQKLKVSKIYVDTIPEEVDMSFIVPVGSIGSGNTHTTGAPGFASEVYSDITEENSRFSHILEFVVEEEDKEEALEQLKEEDAYIDKSLTKK